MKKEQNGRESLRRPKLTVGCNASKRIVRSMRWYAGETGTVSTRWEWCWYPLTEGRYLKEYMGQYRRVHVCTA